MNMFGIRYTKASPTTYVLHYQGGKLRREGAGLAFFYFAPASNIVSIPLGSSAVPFAFQETSADFQTLTVQGQLTYRVADPKQLSSMLDFGLTPSGKYASDDYQKLPDRLVYLLQAPVRAHLQRLPLADALTRSEEIGAQVLGELRAASELTQLGVEILSVAILSLRAAPEMAKALEAGMREALNRRSDEAIYARRNAAVEQERRIKQSELETELAVQEKRRQIRERDMLAEIEMEHQKATLVDQRVDNERKEADSRAYALEATLRPVRDLDWRMLMMMGGQGGDAKVSIAMAFQEMAANAQKIGELNISPELLTALAGGREKGR
jgi:regulator of protease activity HflC (stomatin/prohibitin superfamily)